VYDLRAHVLASAAIWTRISGLAVCAIAGITAVASAKTLLYNSKLVVPFWYAIAGPSRSLQVDRTVAAQQRSASSHRQ